MKENPFIPKAGRVKSTPTDELISKYKTSSKEEEIAKAMRSLRKRSVVIKNKNVSIEDRIEKNREQINPHTDEELETTQSPMNGKDNLRQTVEIPQEEMEKFRKTLPSSETSIPYGKNGHFNQESKPVVINKNTIAVPPEGNFASNGFQIKNGVPTSIVREDAIIKEVKKRGRDLTPEEVQAINFSRLKPKLLNKAEEFLSGKLSNFEAKPIRESIKIKDVISALRGLIYVDESTPLYILIDNLSQALRIMDAPDIPKVFSTSFARDFFQHKLESEEFANLKEDERLVITRLVDIVTMVDQKLTQPERFITKANFMDEEEKKRRLSWINTHLQTIKDLSRSRMLTLKTLSEYTEKLLQPYVDMNTIQEVDTQGRSISPRERTNIYLDNLKEARDKYVTQEESEILKEAITLISRLNPSKLRMLTTKFTIKSEQIYEKLSNKLKKILLK